MKNKIKKFPGIRQTTSNSCWIACAVMIWNYLNPRDVKSIATVRKEYCPGGDRQGSAVELLGKMYKLNDTEYIDKIPMDGYAIPAFEEIQSEIQKKKRPILCCVGSVPPEDAGCEKGGDGRCKAWKEASNGHWILIIGAENRRLAVVDPCDGLEHEVPYDPLFYIKSEDEKFFWENASYIDL